LARLASGAIAELDPYAFMAVVGKRVIHPGGRAATEALLSRAGLSAASSVLEVGCGVATTAVEIARRYGPHVTAVDVSPLMLERAEANVTAADMEHLVTVEHGDILDLRFADDSFDVVLAEAVAMFVDRRRAVAELARVATPGGRVVTSEFVWSRPPTFAAREVVVDQVCPGLEVATVDEWIELYTAAGLCDVETVTGPCQMMTTHGFLADEGAARSLAIMGRVVARPANLRKMAWLMPRMAKTLPYLGYIVVAATKAR